MLRAYPSTRSCTATWPSLQLAEARNSTIVRAMTPAPTTAKRWAVRPPVSTSAARAAEAAVRAALIWAASRQANGCPVSGSFRIRTAEALWTLAATLDGKLLTHLIPATDCGTAV